MATNFPTSVDTLVNPVSNDSLNSPSHSAQHANANDAIEAIETVLVPAVNAWTAWSPVLSGGWANGNGIWSAYYSLIGKTVHFQAFFQIGTTTTKGTGMTVSLPLPAKRDNQQQFQAFSSSYTNANLLAYMSSTTTFTVVALLANATYLTRDTITATVPTTWGTGAVISFNGTYEAA